MATRSGVHARGSPRGSYDEAEDTEPPILEAPSRSPKRPSLASSSGGLSSRSGGSSSQRFGSVRRMPHALVRRSQAQDSDPCMLDLSFESWSDGEEETKDDDRQQSQGQQRPHVQRSHTEKHSSLTQRITAAAFATENGDGIAGMAPLSIRIRKVASTSTLETRPMDSPVLRPQPQAEPAEVAERATTSSFVPSENVLLESQLSLEDGFDMNDSSQFDEAKLRSSAAALKSTPLPSRDSNRSGRWWAAWEASPRFRQWYGRILNSYFAFWLVICSLTIGLIDLILLIVLIPMRHDMGHKPDGERHPLTRGELLPIHYTSAVVCVLLALPVLLPIQAFELYKKREDRRMVRRPYLHVCELLVTVEVVYLLQFAITKFSVLPRVIKRVHKTPLSELLFVVATVVLWVVLWWQLVVFCRFLVHLKLQADAANDATHTSALSDWLTPARGRKNMGLQTNKRMRRRVKDFKKLLFRAAARGDTDEIHRLLEEPSAYGLTGDDAVCALYNKPPTLWCYAFAASNKNPLHIAAQRGHVAIVQRLLEAGFDANALDKVARINFNLGLLFKIATRWLVKTQDGFRSPLRGVLCSVLLPPLHGAVAAGHVDVVRLLLEQGKADPNLLPRASFYYPSAVIPAMFLADEPEIVKLLVAKGANFLHVATTTLSGLASRTYATPLQRSALTLRSATTEYLLSCGADVALTPLHEAAADNVRTVRRLLRRRPNLTSSSVDTLGERVVGVQRRTPLHWAAVVGREATATVLLERGADPNARDRYGRTPLHWAARNNHASVVLLLLARGADATAEDDSGIPVLSFAAEAEGVETRVVAALVEHGASLKHQLLGSLDTPLHIALERENRETATALIRCGADLMVTNSTGKRAVDVTTSTRLQFELKKEAGMRDVMISYPHSHFAFAQRVRSTLETQGKLTCWMDTMDPSGIGGGAVWREEIARGIHNCSVVVSVVCGGYTKSEWCLKELAFAKMIRKPVIALMVEPMEGDDETLDALVPHSHRIAFHDFVTGKLKVPPTGVDFEVDEDKLQAAWRSLLPQLKDAMRKDERTTQKRQLLSESGSRVYSHSESEAERETEDEQKTGEDGDADAVVVGAAEREPVTLTVAVCANVQHSSLRDRLAQDLHLRGFRSHVVTSGDADSHHTELTGCNLLIVVLESQGAEATREERRLASDRLGALLETAARLHVRVFPIVARREFLSFSNLYTLARSELLYFVSGLGEKQSMDALMKQLRSAADTERRR